MIYHIFSHAAAFYSLNRKNVDAMLEYLTAIVSLSDSSSLLFLTYETEFVLFSAVLKILSCWAEIAQKVSSVVYKRYFRVIRKTPNAVRSWPSFSNNR